MKTAHTKSVSFVSVLIAFFLIATTQSVAGAAAPEDGYMSWRVLQTNSNSQVGDVPIRQGYYDSDTDKGFGYDKIRVKHGINDLSLPWLIINYGKRDTATESDGQYTGQVRLRMNIRTTTCLPNLGCNVPNDHRMIAVVHDRESEFYHVARASVKPSEDKPGYHPLIPGTNDRNMLVLKDAEYVSDERIVGLVTCYEEGKNGHVSQHIKEFDVYEYWDGMIA